MAHWYTLEEAQEDWTGLGVPDAESMQLLLDVSKDECLAFSPVNLPAAPPLPAPVAVTVDHLGVTGTASVTRLPGNVLRVDMQLDTADAIDEYFGVTLTSDPDLLPDFTSFVTIPGGPTMQYTNDGFLTRAWGTWPDSVEAAIWAGTAVDDIPPVQVIPDGHRWAHLAHARNIWNSQKVNPSGAFGDDTQGFALTPFPMDWSVRARLRPRVIFGGAVG